MHATLHELSNDIEKLPIALDRTPMTDKSSAIPNLAATWGRSGYVDLSSSSPAAPESTTQLLQRDMSNPPRLVNPRSPDQVPLDPDSPVPSVLEGEGDIWDAIGSVSSSPLMSPSPGIPVIITPPPSYISAAQDKNQTSFATDIIARLDRIYDGGIGRVAMREHEQFNILSRLHVSGWSLHTR